MEELIKQVMLALHSAVSHSNNEELPEKETEMTWREAYERMNEEMSIRKMMNFDFGPVLSLQEDDVDYRD